MSNDLGERVVFDPDGGLESQQNFFGNVNSWVYGR